MEKWNNGKPCNHIKTSKDYFRIFVYILLPRFHPFQILKWRKNNGAIFEPLFTKLKPTSLSL